ncbi:putative transmembrane protein [[Pasteurella] mairii]|uniref:Putative transmembrane protein n=1 Tax=[Pasteurella] mairii TaxID=757 RepID=A0A379B4B7_9PAST|nr:putative transmembrane protein [[Pasteurella] mairii]
MNIRYPKPMILLHWMVDVLVLLAYITGGHPTDDDFVGALHVSSGLSIMVLLVFRLIFRLLFKNKLPKHILPAWQVKLANIVHFALYFCMLLIPLLGLLALAEETDHYTILGINIPMLPDLAMGIGNVHEFFAQVFIALAGIHALAGLAHHFLFKDDVLKAMLPFKNNTKWLIKD